MPDITPAPRFPVPSHSLAACYKKLTAPLPDIVAQIACLNSVVALPDIYCAVWLEEVAAIGAWLLPALLPAQDHLRVFLPFDDRNLERQSSLDALRAHLIEAGHEALLVGFVGAIAATLPQQVAA